MIAAFEGFPRRAARSWLNPRDALSGVSASALQGYLHDDQPWRWINQQTGALRVVEGMGGVDGVVRLDNGSTTSQLIVVGRTLPTDRKTWTFRAELAHRSSAGANGALSGIVLHESGTGKYFALYTGTNPGALVQAARWTNATTFAANLSALTVTGATTAATAGLPQFLEFEYDGTNYITRYGFRDDFSLVTHATTAATTAFTTRADMIGFVVHAPSGTTYLSVKRFWRCG